MSLFPENMPGVEPNMDDAAFWKSCNERRLRFQACGRCGVLRHPPTPMCGACNSTETQWVDAPTAAEVYTFIVVRHASHPAAASVLPYVVAVVTFPALPGVRLVTNVTDIPVEKVHIGMRLELWWDVLADASHIPRFKPAHKEVA